MTTPGQPTPQSGSWINAAERQISDIGAQMSRELANVTTGNFTIDPEMVKPAIDIWNQIIDKLDKARRQADAILAVRGPGGEGASESMAAKTRESGKAYQEHNRELVQKAIAQRDKLNQALQQYQQHEQAAHDQVKQQHRKLS